MSQTIVLDPGTWNFRVGDATQHVPFVHQNPSFNENVQLRKGTALDMKFLKRLIADHLKQTGNRASDSIALTHVSIFNFTVFSIFAKQCCCFSFPSTAPSSCVNPALKLFSKSLVFAEYPFA